MRLNSDNSIDSFKVSDIHNLKVFKGELYFYGYTDSDGEELFKIQGDTTLIAVTNMSNPFEKVFTFKNYAPIPDSIMPSKLMDTSANALYYYKKKNRIAAQKTFELIQFDGTNHNIIDSNLYVLDRFNPNAFNIIDEKIYFESRKHVYAYDIQTDSFFNLPYFVGNPCIRNHFYTQNLNSGYLGYNNKIYFTGSDMSISHLYGYNLLLEYDTTLHTLKYFTINNNIYHNPNPQDFTVYQNKLYFTAYERDTPYFNNQTFVEYALYVYDGIGTPTQLIDTDVINIHEYKGSLYMTIAKTLWDYELYKYNETNNTIQLIKEINPVGPGYPANFHNHLGKMYFSADNDTNGNELWVYDGSVPPVLVADIYPGKASSRPGYFTSKDSMLYFAVNVSEALDINLQYNTVETIHERDSYKAHLYPNPASETTHLQFALQTSEKLSVTITDMSGRVVYKTPTILYSEGQHMINIPVTSLSEGLYICAIKNEEHLLWSGQLKK